MADSAEELLSAIVVVYRRWLAGELSDEDALFEIGDLLAQATGNGGPVLAILRRRWPTRFELNR